MFKYILFLFLISFNVFADNGNYNGQNKENNSTTTEQQVVINIDNSSSQPVDKYTYVPTSNTEGVASAIASSQHHFDFGTDAWQGSLGVGNYENNNAASFSVGKRFDRILFNGTIITENDKVSYGFGLNWRF